MTTQTFGSVSVADAQQMVQAWNDIRFDGATIQSLLQPYYYFSVDDSFDYSVFQGHHMARAYFGLAQGDTPGILSPCLLILTEHDDMEIATGNTDNAYIYQARFMPGGLINTLNATSARERFDRWLVEGNAWINTVTSGEYGMTQVSDVPLDDFVNAFLVNRSFYIFPGLRNEGMQANDNLALLFYDNHNSEFLLTAPQDFTTPKPPFGSNNISGYGLLVAQQQ